MKIFKLIFVFCFVFLFTRPSFSALKDTLILANALQSNMVLQQNKPFKIWGTAPANQKITIQADWMATPIEVTADNNGDFMGIIVIPEATKGNFAKHNIMVNANVNSIKLDNLLIGDLWFCSGQSNMQFSVKEMVDATEVVANANQPNIRLLSVGLNFSAEPISEFSGKWKECSPEAVMGFSAVGYSFGKKLYDELNIPIGLIFSGIGASGVQAYLPQDELQKNSLLNKTYLQPYLNSPKSKEVVNGGFSFEKVMRPYLLYNAMIYPFLNLSIKGFCWYQGEANHLERESYTKATQTMITSWRNRFGQGSLPFYYVQIAPFFHDKEDPKLAFDAFFREAQEKVSELNNTEMVLTMDVGEAKNLHPKNKKPVGERLAGVALNRTYGNLSAVYRGPHYDYAVFNKKDVVIHFEPKSLGSGLSTKDGEQPKFFYIAGSDKVFYPATAVINGLTVTVTSNKVKHPASVRYAFFNYPVTNLQNNDGFPAVPFRTDSWIESK